jgi:hypothetical protein
MTNICVIFSKWGRACVEDEGVDAETAALVKAANK